MSTEFDKLREIFLAALELAPDQRGTYLDQRCAGDEELRRNVAVMLKVHAAGEGPLDRGALRDEQTGAYDDAIERSGTVIGAYKLIEQIGEGGMGTVWMAQQTEPVKRVVALKHIKAGMDSKQVIARFEAERQALALMDHANIARVLDAGTTSAGRPYFIMDLVKGVPITKYCDEHHLTPRQRLELFIPVCQAVQHAHQKGIIHRDLKPSNVLVALYDGKPVPKVIDFGVAKAAGQSLTDKTLVTGFGNIVGTLEYMSPEQAEINQLDIDTRSDIYSLGVLLYELLTGSPPFSRKDLEKAGMLEMLRVIREQEPSKPSTKLSTAEGLPTLAANRGTEPAKLTKLVRGELDWIVMKALEKDRNRRYETATGFAMDVQRYLADEAVLACPPSAGYRLRKFARRNKGPVLAASLVLFVLVAGIIGTTWGMFRATHAEADAKHEAGEKTVALGEKESALAAAKANALEAHKQETLAKESAATAKEQELLARRRFHAAQINLALQACEAGQVARTLELLESLRPRFDQDDLRGFEWYYLWRLCHRNLLRTLSGPTGQVIYTLAVTPDGKTVISGHGDGSVRVWDVATGKERALLNGHSLLIWRVAISPDGKLAASGSMDLTAKLWDLGTNSLQATLADRTAMVRSLAFSPDGKTLAVGAADWALELWDVATRKRRLKLPARTAPPLALAYSPDGKMLATGQGWNERQSNAKGGVKVWDVTAEPPRMIFQGEVANSAAFSPDSKLLATGHNDAKVWNVPSGELKATFESSGVESVAFSADGKTLVLGCHDRTVKLWDYSTGATRTVGIHLAAVNAVAFVPQSDLLASGSNDGTVKIWRAGPPQDEITFVHDSAIRSLTFTPDSKLLVVGSDGLTPVLDAATGKKTAAVPVPGVLAASTDANLLAAWAPDGKRLIWDVAAAQARSVVPAGTNPTGAAFSRDGKTLVTWIWDANVPEHTLQVWDLDTSRVRFALTDNTHCAAFSPDEKTLATGQQFGWVKLWDARTGQPRMTLQQSEGATLSTLSVAFSNDGKMLAAGNSAGALRLWDVETGQLKMSFKGHTHGIRSVAFSPDGKSLLSGSNDRSARLWDVVTGQELLAVKGHKSPVHLVAFSPDGKRLATASANEVRLWLGATEPEATAFYVEVNPDDPDSPRAMNNWADRLQGIHRSQEAENAYRKALARLEKLAAAVPDIPEYRQELAYTLHAAVLSGSDPEQTAERAYRRFQEICRTLPPDRKLGLAEMLHRRGHVNDGMRRWKQAVADFSAAIELAPESLIWHFCRARAYMELEEWQKAAEDCAVWMESPGATHRVWYEYALLSLSVGQKANYQKACAQMLKRFGQATGTDAARMTVWTCLLGADAVADWTEVLRIAERAHAGEPKSYDKINDLGAALYRAGGFKEAAQRLAEAEAMAKQSPTVPSGLVYTWLFQAMAHHRLGNAAEAADRLRKAVQAIDEPLAATGAAPAPPAWNRRLTLQLLRREANAALKARRDQLQPGVIAVWNFDAGCEDWGSTYQGIVSPYQCTVSASGGILHIRTTGADPYVIVPVAAPAGWKELTLHVQTNRECQAQLFWATERTADFAEERSVYFTVKPGRGEWTQVKVRFRPNSALTALRLDPAFEGEVRWEIDAATLANVAPPPK